MAPPGARMERWSGGAGLAFVALFIGGIGWDWLLWPGRAMWPESASPPFGRPTLERPTVMRWLDRFKGRS